jgi:small subunit ribosomal protein S18
MVAESCFHSTDAGRMFRDSNAGLERREAKTYLKGNIMADETHSTQSTEHHAPASRPSGGHSGGSSHSGPGAGPRTPRPAGAPGGGPGGRKFFRRKKVCKFCTEKIDAISYRDVRLLQGFVAERGKIVPRRLTGVCTRHQRRLSLAIKQSRNIALLAFAARF